MLAYVFWHWPQPGSSESSYIESLRPFHDLLAIHKPAGFLSSAVFRIQGAGWLPVNTQSYEDWYLLDGSGALDILNDAAVTPPLKDPHDRAARGAAGGIAGLYRLRRGSRDVTNAQHALWFSKPQGTTYDDLYRLLDAIVARSGAGVWGRQMTLGPTPEFCLLSEEALDVPDVLRGQPVPHDRIWP